MDTKKAAEALDGAQLLREAAHELRETSTRPPLHQWEDQDTDARAAHDKYLDAAEAVQALIEENEALRAGYAAAERGIESLKAQLEAVRALRLRAQLEIESLHSQLEALAATETVAPAQVVEYPSLGKGSLWRDEKGIRGYGADPGNGPWYTKEEVHQAIDADRAAQQGAPDAS